MRQVSLTLRITLLHIGEDDKLIDIRDEGEEKNVEHGNSRIDRAIADNTLVGRDSSFELGEGPFANVHRVGGGPEGYPQVDPVGLEADTRPTLVYQPFNNAFSGRSGSYDGRFLLVILRPE